MFREDIRTPEQKDFRKKSGQSGHLKPFIKESNDGRYRILYRPLKDRNDMGVMTVEINPSWRWRYEGKRIAVLSFAGRFSINGTVTQGNFSSRVSNLNVSDFEVLVIPEDHDKIAGTYE